MLSHNTYSYCRNSVVTASDKDGMDAIWILDSNDLSHASLLLQDADGKWWYYYWRANIGDSSNDSLAGVQSFGYYGAVIKPLGENNFKILWGALDLDISNYNDAGIKCIQAAINNKFGKQCEYDKGIYFEGDFSNSWNNAQWRYNNPWALVYDPVFITVLRLLLIY